MSNATTTTPMANTTTTTHSPVYPGPHVASPQLMLTLIVSVVLGLIIIGLCYYVYRPVKKQSEIFVNREMLEVLLPGGDLPTVNLDENVDDDDDTDSEL